MSARESISVRTEPKLNDLGVVIGVVMIRFISWSPRDTVSRGTGGPPASRNHHNGRNRKRYSNVLGSLGSLVRLVVLIGAYRDPRGLGRGHGAASVICG